MMEVEIQMPPFTPVGLREVHVEDTPLASGSRRPLDEQRGKDSFQDSHAIVTPSPKPSDKERPRSGTSTRRLSAVKIWAKTLDTTKVSPPTPSHPTRPPSRYHALERCA